MNTAVVEAPAPTNHALSLLQAQVQQLEACSMLAERYCSTEMVPKQYQGKAASGAVAIAWGAEIGLAPLQSLQNIAVINGSPALWGDALVAIVRGSGQCDYLTTNYDEKTQTATVKTRRVNEPEEVRTYSMDNAKVAGLSGSNTYQKHPQRMISARARSHVLRDVYADLLKGFNVREIAVEDNETYNLDGRKEKDVTPTESATINNLLKTEVAVDESKMSIEDYILAASTAADLQAAGSMIPTMDEGSEKERLKELWFQMKEEMANGGDQ